MKATLESTSKIVELKTADGGMMPARIWEGKTESGIPFHAFIVRVAVPTDAVDRSQFDAELKQTRAPSPDVALYPLRMIL